jgi:ribose 5-phosphate isomerase A
MKRKTALEAVNEVKNGYIIGLGSGSTIAYAIEELGRRIKEDRMDIRGIPTSYATMKLAVKYGVPLTTLNENPRPDIALDGADQVDQDLNLIKGLGGALTREKIVDNASKQLVIIVDERKLTKKLGTNQIVPIEIIPVASTVVANTLDKLGGKSTIRKTNDTTLEFITDNGNFILDVDFGAIDKPIELENRLRKVIGIVETGLFLNMTHKVYVGRKNGTVKTLNKLEEVG